MNPIPETLIAVDWGSTHFRAKLVIDGGIVDSVSSRDGIRHREGRLYDFLLALHCEAWKHLHPEVRVFMSGMIGSREGWHEVAYVTAPCGIADLAAAVVSVPSKVFGEVFIVPGVRWDDPDNDTSDVIRGEETQVAGLLDQLPADGATICLPGTHSKWVRCRRGRIESFRTSLTGEAFERITHDSLISGDGSPAHPESRAFRLGLERSSRAGGLLHHLFLGRTGMLTGRIDASEMRSFISGLLVGHEIREARSFSPDLPVHLVGDTPASAATAAGLEHFGIPYEKPAGDAHLDGLLAIAAALRACGGPS